jgi:hypothetical protein
MNQVYGNQKHNQEDGDNAKNVLQTPDVRVMESQIAGKRLMFTDAERLEAGKTKKTRAAFLAAIRSEKDKPQDQSLLKPPANRGADPVGTTIRTFHGPITLS